MLRGLLCAKADRCCLSMNASGAAAVKVLSRPAREPFAEMLCAWSELKEVEKTERWADATLGGMTNHGRVIGDQSANLCHK